MGLNTFTFAGTASSTYNLFIKEAAPYNAPERSVEMISIPGRNGAYALDHGRFENIEVTYKVCVYDEDHSDFQAEISDVRNWLCSKVGYQRLTDDYNPSEYRMAVYKSGLETDKVFLNGSEFDITFECKPQRFLTSGETAVSVASGGKVTNPTLFDARPQLRVVGYGAMDIGGSEILVDNVPIGDIALSGNQNVGGFASFTRTYSAYSGTKLNTSDEITIDYSPELTYEATNPHYKVDIVSITSATNCNAYVSTPVSNATTIKIDMDTLVVPFGTGGSKSFSVQYDVKVYNNQPVLLSTTTCTVSGSVTDNGHGRTVYTISHSPSINSVTNTKTVRCIRRIPKTRAYSTKSALGNPMYIDLDIGEAWNADGGEIVSVNDAVQLPAELPVLPSGDTTITYDNTFTSFKVVPRWWKV